MTLFELWPERHYGRTRQPRLSNGVLLEKSRWGKRELLFSLFVFSPMLTFPKLFLLPGAFLFSLSPVAANSGPLKA